MVGVLSTFWKESLEFFSLGNAKLFVLATLNNFKNSLTCFLKHFWWMFAIVIIAQQMDFLVVQFVALFFLNFFFILAVRPSVELKNYRYFMQYTEKVPAYFLIVFSFIIFWVIFFYVFDISYATSLTFLPVSPLLI